MSKKCLLRVEQLLAKSSIKAARKDEIINQISTALQEMTESGELSEILVKYTGY